MMEYAQYQQRHMAMGEKDVSMSQSTEDQTSANSPFAGFSKGSSFAIPAFKMPTYPPTYGNSTVNYNPDLTSPTAAAATASAAASGAGYYGYSFNPVAPLFKQDTSPRRGLLPQLNREPAKDSDNRFICSFAGCTEPMTFTRRCEWAKHMDKHDRPYKCLKTECESLPGFTYCGGLLRHEREVHRMPCFPPTSRFGSPVNGVKRHSCDRPGCEKSYSREEHLKRHLLSHRRYTQEPGTGGAALPSISSLLQFKVQPLRNEFLEKQKAKDLESKRVTAYTRLHMTTGMSDPIFTTHQKAVIAARDACGPIENACHALEYQLFAAESDIAKLEGRLLNERTKGNVGTEPLHKDVQTPPRIDTIDDSPLYVNAKQFHRILKRRSARQNLDEALRLSSKGRKPYLRDSRHSDAMRSPRAPGGRFLTSDEIAEMEISKMRSWLGRSLAGVAWKGLMNDPDDDDSWKIHGGLRVNGHSFVNSPEIGMSPSNDGVLGRIRKFASMIGSSVSPGLFKLFALLTILPGAFGAAIDTSSPLHPRAGSQSSPASPSISPKEYLAISLGVTAFVICTILSCRSPTPHHPLTISLLASLWAYSGILSTPGPARGVVVVPLTWTYAILTAFALALVDIHRIHRAHPLKYSVMHFCAQVLCAGVTAGVLMVLMSEKELIGYWGVMPHGFAIAIFAVGGFVRAMIWIWSKMSEDAQRRVQVVFASPL